MKLPDLNRLRTLFSPRRRTPGNRAESGGWFGRRELVVPRARLLYRAFDLSAVPAAQRARALQIKLDAWRPLDAVRYWSGWQGGMAQVWAWSADDPELQPAAGERVLPEPLTQAPMTEGMRLVHCLEGFEGQHWHDGVLRLARWWPAPPRLVAWHAFLRAAGCMPQPVSEPVRPPETPRPWARRVGAQSAWWAEQETRWVTATAALLALLIGWQLGGWWNAQRVLQQHADQLAALQSSAAAPLADRERALSAVARFETLRKHMDRRSPLELLDEVTAALPQQLALRRWQQQPQSLVFEIEGESAPDPETVVRALQPIAGLEQIIAERGREPNRLELSAVLDGAEP